VKGVITSIPKNQIMVHGDHREEQDRKIMESSVLIIKR